MRTTYVLSLVTVGKQPPTSFWSKKGNKKCVITSTRIVKRYLELSLF